jgi:hypothetical protein
VQQKLFSIICTTCRARIAVLNESAIGAILECPKCQCMVPVIPPAGWQPPQACKTPEICSAPAESDSAPAEAASAIGSFFQSLRSWYAIGAASIVALIVLVAAWLLMFSQHESDNTATPPPAVTGKPDDKQPSDEAEKNTVDAQPEPDAQPAETKTAEQKPSDAAAPVTAKTPTIADDEKATESKPTEQNAAEVNKSADTKDKQTAVKPNQAVEPAPPAKGTSKLVKLIAPEQIDAQSRLADMIPKVDFRGMPFARAIGLVAGLSGLPVTIDPDALDRLGVSLRDPITVRLTGSTLEEVFQAIASQRGMAVVAEDGQILITAPADQSEKLRRIRYTVSDLTGDDRAAMDHLALLVQKLIAPQTWQDRGSQGIIETDKTALVVTQSNDVHDQILVFCEKLRNARGRPLKSNRDPKRFALTTRLDQAEAVLNRRVSANFHEPAALVDFLGYLGQQAEADILIDRQALGAAGMSDKSEVSFTVENKPLSEVLADLLPPLKLGYRPINAHTIQVTTLPAIAARMELEFYPVRKILSKDLSGPDLIEKIKMTISPAKWNDANLSPAIFYDQPSAAIIVLQSPPVQAEIHVFLNKTMENQK